MTHESTPAELVETLATTMFAIATHAGPMGYGNGVVYRAVELALMTGIREVYGAALAERIRDLHVDCNESIAYCAEYAAREARELADVEAREALDGLTRSAARPVFRVGDVVTILDGDTRYDVTRVEGDMARVWPADPVAGDGKWVFVTQLRPAAAPEGPQMATTVTITLGGETRTVTARCAHPGGIDTASAARVAGVVAVRGATRYAVELTLYRVSASAAVAAPAEPVVTDTEGRQWIYNVDTSVRNQPAKIVGWE